MLTIGGLVLLMIAVLNANRMIVNTDVEPANSENQTIIAASAEDLLAEIRSKKFDQKVVDLPDSTVLKSEQFTSYNFLGPDAAKDSSIVMPDSGNYQSMRAYNDIDDYNGYVRTVRMQNSAVYHLDVVVYYVSDSDLENESYIQQYLKKVMITAYLQPGRTLKFSTIIAY